MQLTGDRFTSATAVLGNDLATLPDFPAEIRAPAGTVHGVSAFQIQFASSDITTPGDHADVLVAMNPAALKADLDKVIRGGTRDHQRGRVHPAEHREGGVRDRPRRRRHARRLPGLQGADDLDHGPRDRGHRDRQEGGRAGEEHVRARAPVVDVRPPAGDHAQLARAEVRRQAGDLRRERGGVQGRLQLRRDDRAVRALVPGQGRAGRARAPTATSPGRTRPVVGARSRPAQRSGLPLFYASYPITPASELLHELSTPQELRCDHAAGRGRDRRREHGARCGVRGAVWP